MDVLNVIKSYLPKEHRLKELYLGGNLIEIPLSESILVVTRKNISNKKAMSAIEPALISGIALFCLPMFINDF